MSQKIAFPWIEINKTSFIRCSSSFPGKSNLAAISCWIVHILALTPHHWVARYLDREANMSLHEIGRYRTKKGAQNASDRHLKELGYRLVLDKVMVLA
jgi:hypothetical protein